MRSSIIKVIYIFLGCIAIQPVHAAPSRLDCLVKLGNSVTKDQLDACISGNLPTPKSTIAEDSPEEVSCVEIGFKKKTEGFRKCVLELKNRSGGNAPEVVYNDPDDATCKGYGFKPKTTSYAECRQKIEMFKAESQQRQAAYEAQKKQYDEQVAAIEKEKRRQASSKTFLYAMSLLGGQTPMQAYGTSQGYPPAPQPPSPMNQTYVFPNGKMMNCNTVGNTTNCF
jgi:hypothetical protein